MYIYELVCGDLLTPARIMLGGELPAPGEQQTKFIDVAWLQWGGGIFTVVLHLFFNV